MMPAAASRKTRLAPKAVAAAVLAVLADEQSTGPYRLNCPCDPGSNGFDYHYRFGASQATAQEAAALAAQ